MNGELREIADVLEAIARKSAAGGNVAAFCSATAQEEVLIVTASAERGDLVRHLLDGRGAVMTFADLAASPSRAFTARVLIGAFDCGELIAASDLEMVNQSFLTRPAGTYGFMFLGADRSADPEDRDRLERSAWRLLVPEPKPRWAQQDLAEFNVFFLPSESSTDGLSRLMNVPDTLADQLSGAALRRAADLLEDELEHLRRNAVREPNALDDLRRVTEEFEELRRRARGKIGTASAELHRGMETSVLRLRQELLNGLDGALRGGGPTELRQADLRQRFQRLLSTAVDRWTRSAQAQIEQGMEDIATDVFEGVASVDWATVNRAAATIGRAAGYPDALVKALTSHKTPHELRPPIPAASGRNDDPPPVLVLLGTGGVAIALWALAGPIPTVIGSLLLGAGGWVIYKEQGIRRYSEHARSVIVAITEQILAQLDDVLNDCVQELRRRMKDELQKAEKLLGDAANHLEGSGLAASQTEELSAVRELRRRLEEMS